MKKMLISIVIFTCLGLQGAVVFGLQPDHGGAFFWPFTDYPMYRNACYRGDVIERYFLFGRLEGLEPVLLRPADFCLNHWTFMNGPVQALRDGNEKRVLFYVDIYEGKQGRKLIGLKLERHPWVIEKGGAISRTAEVVREIKLEDGVVK